MTEGFHHWLGDDVITPTLIGDTPEPLPLPAEMASTLERMHIPLPQPIDDIAALIEAPSSVTEDTFTPGTPAPIRGINPKDALGLAKVDMSVVPPSALLHLASAMMDGAGKYGAFNWRDNAVLGRIYVAAAMRHLMQYLDGEDFDPVSKVHHLGHAMACCAIILDAMETGNLDDNRPMPGVAGEMIRGWDQETKFQ